MVFDQSDLLKMQVPRQRRKDTNNKRVQLISIQFGEWKIHGIPPFFSSACNTSARQSAMGMATAFFYIRLTRPYWRFEARCHSLAQRLAVSLAICLGFL
jgi:hypothetical protein